MRPGLVFGALVVGGVALFLALAILDQWSFFATAWFGSAKAPSGRSQGPPAGAVGAVESFLAWLPDYYRGASASGDRFRGAPLAEPLRRELATDAAYLGWRGWSQELSMVRHRIVDASPLPKERWEIVTDESWRVRVGGTGGGGEREVALRCRYTVGLLQGRWTIGGWTLEPSPVGVGP